MTDPEYAKQFETLKFNNKKINNVDPYNNYSKFNNNSMTYNVLNDSELKHDKKIVPSLTQNFNINKKALGDIHQRKLKLHTGSSTKKKKEIKPMFNPAIGFKDMMPISTTNETKKRCVVSRDKPNVLPFEQVKVTPGLNLGYTEKGTHGLHDPYRIKYKNIDEIRTIDKQQKSYTLPMNMGGSELNEPQVPKFKKYRKVNFREMDMDDYIGGPSGHIAPPIHGKILKRALINNKKEHSIKNHQFSGASSIHASTNRPNNPESVRVSSKNNTIPLAQMFGNVVSSLFGTRIDSPDEFVNMSTNRSTENKDIRGNISTNYSNPPWKVQDPLKLTNKNMYKESVSMGGPTQISNNYVVDNERHIDPTKRNMYDSTNRMGTSLDMGSQNGYVLTPDDAPDFNPKRNIQPDRMGFSLNTDIQNIQSLKKADAPDFNPRRDSQPDRMGFSLNMDTQNTHIISPDDIPAFNPRKDTKLNRMGASLNMDIQYIPTFSSDDIPDFNPRRDFQPNRMGSLNNMQHELQTLTADDIPDFNPRRDAQPNRMGTSLNNMKQELRTATSGDVPDFNPLRDTQFNRMGTALENSQFISKTYNPNDVPDINLRNIHNVERDNAPVGSFSGYSINYESLKPSITKRNLMRQNTMNGIVHGYDKGYTPLIDDVKNPKKDMIKHSMHLGSISKEIESGYTINYENLIPDGTKKEMHIKNSYIGLQNNSIENPPERHNVNNMQINDDKEIIIAERDPTQINYNKGKTSQFTSTRIPDKTVTETVKGSNITYFDTMNSLNFQLNLLRKSDSLSHAT
jgi:hypothetical protein